MIVCGHRINPQQPFDLVYEAIKSACPQPRVQDYRLSPLPTGFCKPGIPKYLPDPESTPVSAGAKIPQ
jgi:hypothetical protein